MCIALLTITIVVLCIGMKFLMISLDVQFIGIKLVMKASVCTALLMISIVVCIGIKCL